MALAAQNFSHMKLVDAFHLPGPIKLLSIKTVTGQTEYHPPAYAFLSIISPSFSHLSFLLIVMEGNVMKSANCKSA